MSRILIVAIIIFTMPLLAFSQKGEKLSEKQRQEIAQQILKIENEWTQMFVTREFSGLEKMLADDYVGSDVDSRRGKAVEIAGYKQNTDKVASAAIENVKTHIFTKDAAIVTGELIIKGQTKDGKDFTNRYRFTDTYVKRNGVWQCVAAHATYLK
jgi:ketosteroid isomerase-like protein